MPYLNPFLRKFPISISIPEVVKEVLWEGKKLPVVNKSVQLIW
jgi:hypothetical protein